MSELSPAAEIISVPGERTLLPSGYFCVIESESLPVGILMPKAVAKSLAALTAEYNLASSPKFLHGHIQLAEREIPLSPSLRGVQTIFVRDSDIAILLPASAFIRAMAGACPIEVAIPSRLL